MGFQAFFIGQEIAKRNLVFHNIAEGDKHVAKGNESY